MRYFSVNGARHALDASADPDEWLGSGWVEITREEAAMQAPELVRTPEERLASLPPVSHAQMIAALILTGIITEGEGVAWITGTLPDAVEAMIDNLPADQRIIVRLRAIRPSSVVPTDPLVAALAAAHGHDTDALIDLFQVAAAL